jgi:hypothetical protein
MKLSDVRKMAIRQQTRVRFRLSNGQECVVNEHGVARVPGIRDVSPPNLETELAGVPEVQLENIALAKPVVRTVSRAEFEKLVVSQPVAAHDDHDE